MNKLKQTIFLLAVAVFISSCSKDDEPKAIVEESEDPQIGLFAEDGMTVIQVPQAMTESEDPHAIMATAYVGLSTSFSIYGAFFMVPEGATKTDQPITAANGRIMGGYTVYEWEGADGATIAYQYSESGGQEVFEIFIKEGGKDYLKFMEVIQDPDGRSGSMEWFSELGMSASWTWEVRNDESYFLVFSSEDERYEVESFKDLSGNVKFFTDGLLRSEISWDKKGNGVWTDFDEAGLVEDEGEWKAA